MGPVLLGTVTFFQIAHCVNMQHLLILHLIYDAFFSIQTDVFSISDYRRFGSQCKSSITTTQILLKLCAKTASRHCINCISIVSSVIWVHKQTLKCKIPFQYMWHHGNQLEGGDCVKMCEYLQNVSYIKNVHVLIQFIQCQLAVFARDFNKICVVIILILYWLQKRQYPVSHSKFSFVWLI